MCLLLKRFFVVCLLAVNLFACEEKNNAASHGSDGIIVTPDSTIALADTSQKSAEHPDDNNIYADVDISPMDMSYFPAKYPQLKMTNPDIAPPVMRVIYSRPHLQGRNLFEGILKYDQVWRLGANEATELDVFQPVTIGDKKIVPGRYSLYAIPKAGYWTIAVNTDLDLWGLKQDTAMDVVRVQIPVTYYNPVMEYFTMVFEKTDTGANLIMAWDDVVARLPIKTGA